MDTQSGEGTGWEGQPNNNNNNHNNTGAKGQSGLRMGHMLLHPTMCASLLTVKGGSSISEADTAGIASSRDRKPLLSIRLGGMGPHKVAQQFVMILL